MKDESKQKVKEVLKLIVIIILCVVLGIPLLGIILAFILALSPCITLYLIFNAYFNYKAEKIELNLKHIALMDKRKKNYEIKTKKYDWN